MTRRYVVMRTDKNVKPFILAELSEGRLRQGWGYRPELNLKLLRKKIDSGKKLTDEEAAAWRNRRLLDTEPDGLKPGDIIILPNIPEQGLWVLARVSGPYSYAIANNKSLGGPDYGHIVQVTPIREKDGSIAVVEPDNEHVDARLRASMRSMSRMWSVDALGQAVEHLISAIEGGANIKTPEPEAQKIESLFSALRAAAWTNLQTKYKAAELERLVLRLFKHIYQDGRVEHWGGAGEKGADLIVFTQDPLGLEFKIAVQVKHHDGVHADPHALHQIKQAREAHQVDAGVIVTTAAETSKEFDDQRAALEVELAIDIRVIARDELVELIMTHLGGDRKI
jgi:hypothetical protein